MFKQKFTRKCMAYSLTLAMVLTGAPLLPITQTTQKAAAQTTLSNPTVSTDKTTWDCVYFGNYWQSDTNGDGTADTSDSKEPIKWRVLSVNGDDMFLLADQNLDARAYNTNNEAITWEKCTLRSWLNGYGAASNTDGEDYSSAGASFLSNAFSSSEQSDIMSTNVVNDDNAEYSTEGGNNTTDKVYLLSIAEASNTSYGFNGTYGTESGTRISKNTGYTAAQSAMSSVGKADSWWLHSPGSDCDHAASVNNYGCGSDNGLSVDSSFYAVRPALHLSLSSSSWSYAGTVSADVGESSSVTAAPGETTDPGDTTTPEESADPGDTVAPGETMAPGNTQSPRNTKTPGSTSGSASTSTPNATNTSTTNYTNRYYTPAPTVMPTASASVATKSVVTVQTPAKGRVISAKSRQGKKIVVKLANITGADGYQIKYSTKKNFKAATTRFIKKRTCTLSKLKKKTYYIKVRAYVLNYEEFEIQYGKWSSVKKVTVKR